MKVLVLCFLFASLGYCGCLTDKGDLDFCFAEVRNDLPWGEVDADAYCSCFAEFPKTCLEGVDEECDLSLGCKTLVGCRVEKMDCFGVKEDTDTILPWGLCDCVPVFHACIDASEDCSIHELVTNEDEWDYEDFFPCGNPTELAKLFYVEVSEEIDLWFQENGEDWDPRTTFVDDLVLFIYDKEEYGAEDALEFCEDFATFFNELLAEDCEAAEAETCKEIHGKCHITGTVNAYTGTIIFSASSSVVVSFLGFLVALVVFFF
eukprot:TRINITY_DN2400_c0_g1_i1.p1 TRINITY_DN2400_c0_g1~~TRINITY_DN2400_c0_g1_i1.p1  ORF type:complete len:262 (-),score=59.19 TRINITY_DN2400_c0_g1_i1:47-832(-)